MAAILTETATDPKLDTLRAQLPAARRMGYFNAGANGPLPIPVHEAMAAVAREELENGRAGLEYFGQIWERAASVRAEIAACFGADPLEIALTRSSNEGLNIALFGLDWQRGDEAVTTHLEHPGLLVPLCAIADRFGVNLRVADVGDAGGDVVGAIEARLSPRTRVIAVSHVMWSSGAIVPLADLADLARRRGVLLVVDGAQGAGQVPVDFRALGVDAYAMSGQKWLLGPEGTGALYVRADRLADIRPTRVRYAQMDVSGYVLPVPGARRYEMGELNGAAIAGQQAAHRWLRDEVGFAWAHGRTAANGRRLWDALAAVPGVTMATPRERMAGLVCYNVAGLTPEDVAGRLAERNFATRYVVYPPGPSVARVSCGWWNTEEELDALAAAVAELAAEHRPMSDGA